MKNIIPTTLMFAGLCPLLPAPCSAQETENKPLEAVTAGNPEAHYSLFESTRDRLTDLANDLCELEDKAEADACAADAEYAEFLGFTMRDAVCIYLDRVRKGQERVTPEQMQEIKDCVKAVASVDTHGSEGLAQLLWGWKHLSGLLEQGADTELFEKCFRRYMYCAQAYLFFDPETLSEIKDKESADEIVGYIEDIVKDLRGEDGDGCPYTPAPEEFKAWVTLMYGTEEEAVAKVRKYFDAFKAKDYYGSKELEEAVLMLDKPYVPLEEQQRRSKEYWAIRTTLDNELMELLRGVKDMAGSDAIAPRVAEIYAARTAATEEYNSWRDSIYFNEDSISMEDVSAAVVRSGQLHDIFDAIKFHCTDKLFEAMGIGEDVWAEEEEEE